MEENPLSQLECVRRVIEARNSSNERNSRVLVSVLVGGMHCIQRTCSRVKTLWAFVRVNWFYDVIASVSSSYEFSCTARFCASGSEP